MTSLAPAALGVIWWDLSIEYHRQLQHGIGWTFSGAQASFANSARQAHYPWRMFRRFVIAAVVLAPVVSATAVSPAAAKTTQAVGTHRLIVVVEKNLPPAAEKKLSVLVLISQNGGAPAGALATPSKPLTVLLDNRGLYRIKIAIDSCRGTCTGSYRISGSANHKLEVVPSCQRKSSGFVCSKVKIVKLY
jgi:hypothetical protein